MRDRLEEVGELAGDRPQRLPIVKDERDHGRQAPRAGEAALARDGQEERGEAAGEARR